MDNLKKIFSSASSKIPKNIPNGGGGLVSGVIKGLVGLVGIGLVGYGAYESIVTGK